MSTPDPGNDRPLVVVTGASSGIGAASARALAADGWHPVLGARRLERLEQLADEIGATALELDVTRADSVAAFAAAVRELVGPTRPLRGLVNNAGGAQGTETVAEADEEKWRWMWESNVLGTMRVTKALLPLLLDSGDGHIVTITSIAALEVYDGGSGYTSAKHAEGALHRTLRGELLGQPVRLTEIAPGAVETEFSLVRFGGDETRAAKVYEGLEPLVAEDVAEVVAFAMNRPSHVNLDTIVLKPRAQATGMRFHREGSQG
ncbi:SDR family NAD(P)-dependent oxidoreductase [Actinomycetospora cinnamomea]|uniref:NADP-dependent 3-hydroxy acid dehydrogenase YdfG n=1 Tax=Actinomycetospora cinnamomea TaxID=663609 RepID=A0A2U1FCZ8_9PSEU|nr:SDR family NAD(P)-dependent oxidoreductase [Actinomycetospora cinnamomea]PVZ10052.1 NADP-dependent 3-hydroxy acid dehydrogenase YdfG [Actinomycetospora cinnamomea]